MSNHHIPPGEVNGIPRMKPNEHERACI